jgi:predicted phosphodiesterase
MNDIQFRDGVLSQMAGAPELSLEDRPRVVVMSDFHMGDGSARDALRHNGELLAAILERYYLDRGSTLVLNGDIEELQKFPLAAVRSAWPGLYALFDRFAAGPGLFKILGNHDESLLDEPGYPYPLLNGLSLRLGDRLMYVFHGHQASGWYVNHNALSGAFVRYLFGTLRIPSPSVSRDSRRKFGIERRIYDLSRACRMVSIIGHTHRPLFESLSKYDWLRFEIERLCAEYAPADEALRREIAARVAVYREEFQRLRRRERRRSRSMSLYGTDILLPCLFNSGSAVGRKGVTAIEVEDGRIQLAYWFEDGRVKRYLEAEAARGRALPGTPYRRAVLGSARVDYLLARIDLLA